MSRAISMTAAVIQANAASQAIDTQYTAVGWAV